MHASYFPAKRRSQPLLNGAIAVFATSALFAVLPLLGLIANFTPPTTLTRELIPAQLPPQIVVPPPPVADKEIIHPKPKIDLPAPEISLIQLEWMIHPGRGSGIGSAVANPLEGFAPSDDIEEIFNLNDVDKRPSVLVQAQPAYPYSMQRSRTEGSVTVEFIIDAQGKVIRPRVVSASHREFESAAIEAVTRSRYRPALREGQPVAVRTKVAIAFKP